MMFCSIFSIGVQMLWFVIEIIPMVLTTSSDKFGLKCNQELYQWYATVVNKNNEINFEL